MLFFIIRYKKKLVKINYNKKKNKKKLNVF